jgi:hypothetical protein
MKKILLGVAALLVLILGSGAIYMTIRTRQTEETPLYLLLHQDQIINADLWSDQPEILSAGYGFDGIIGIDGGEAEVRAVGGAWNTVECTSGEAPERRVLTSSAETAGMDNGFDAIATNADGLPVVFSYRVLSLIWNTTSGMWW